MLEARGTKSFENTSDQVNFDASRRINFGEMIGM